MMLDLAFGQLRHYTAGDAAITLRVLDALAEIAQVTRDPERHAAIWRHAGMISRAVEFTLTEPYERGQINERLREIAARCGVSPQGIELANAEMPAIEPLTKAAEHTQE